MDVLPYLDKVTAVGVIVMCALAVITDKLVWHKRLEKAERERDEWRDLALRSIGVSERMAGPVEVVADVMRRLSDPSAEGDGS